jgi:hypothetical protein
MKLKQGQPVLLPWARVQEAVKHTLPWRGYTTPMDLQETFISRATTWGIYGDEHTMVDLAIGLATQPLIRNGAHAICQVTLAPTIVTNGPDQWACEISIVFTP